MFGDITPAMGPTALYGWVHSSFTSPSSTRAAAAFSSSAHSSNSMAPIAAPRSGPLALPPLDWWACVEEDFPLPERPDLLSANPTSTHQGSDSTILSTDSAFALSMRASDRFRQPASQVASDT